MVYFYFDQNYRRTQNAEFVIKCLLKQLVFQLSGQTESLPMPLRFAYEKFTFEGSKITPTVTDFADIFIACARSCTTPVFVLLDAYNDYEENFTNPLMSILLRFIKSGTVRIYITTQVQLQGIPWPSPPLHLKIEAPDKDVRRCVQAMLESTTYHSDLKDKIVDSVTKKAKGLYISLRRYY